MVRFERILESNEHPAVECMDAEQLFLTMIQDTANLMNADVAYTAQTLPAILQSVPEEIRARIGRELEILDPDADSREAVTTLVQWTGPASDPSILALLAASLAKIHETLEEKPEQEPTILQYFWDQGSQGMISRLTEIFAILLDAIPVQDPMQLIVSSNVSLLFTFIQLLDVVERFVHTTPVPVRSLRKLVKSIVSLYTLCMPLGAWQDRLRDDKGYVPTLRHKSIAILPMLCIGNDIHQVDHGIATAILQELLSLDPISEAFDPVSRLEATSEIILQVMSAVDPHEKGRASTESWNQDVLPNILPSLSAFLHILPPNLKVELTRLFSERDHGQLGIGEWLILQEINELSYTLEVYANDRDIKRLMLHYQEVRDFLGPPM